LSRISASPYSDRAQWPQIYLGVFFTALATLLLELSLTRIFSVVFYYHFAFLAISIALFGLGAGGVFSYVVAGWRGSLYARLGALAALNSVAVLGSLIFLLTRSGEPGNLTLALVYFTTALPFFLAGTVLSLVIADTVQKVDRVYFFDLIGAGAGCLLLVPLLNRFGGPNTVIAAAAVYAVSAAIWFNLAGKRAGRAGGVGFALALVFLLIYNARVPVIDVRYAKGARLSGERFVKWNSSSRVALAPEGNTGRVEIVIDADAATSIPNIDFANLAEKDRAGLLSQGPGIPYALRPGAKTLVIGPGGGYDVARALAGGSRDVTGVEINPIIANTIMRERFAALSGGLYLRPDVHIHVEDGRSFVRRTRERYQVIQATLVDTWASTAAGAFALSESTLYTTDAFRDYLDRLTGDGVLAFTRWGFEPPRESLRVVVLARAALEQLGERDAAQHVIVLREGSPEDLARWGNADTILIARKPFLPSDIARIRQVAATGGVQAVYLPGDHPANAFGEYLLRRDPSPFLENYAYDVSPVDDNRPFFFYTVQPRDIWQFATSASRPNADYKINRAVPMLFGLTCISLLAVMLTLALPPLLLGNRLPCQAGARAFLGYFVLIGVGYILIQVALIQKFVLFLGHPTYALTVIVFSMLIASGLGSYYSSTLLSGRDGRWRAMLVAAAAVVAVLALAAGPLTSGLVGLPLAARVLVSALAILPAGFLMGMPFPTGLARLDALHKPAVRWAWALNAASSVLGSVAAIFLAIYLGLRETLLVGAACYVGASFLIRPLRVERTPDSVTI
jgi:hypothetical protein